MPKRYRTRIASSAELDLSEILEYYQAENPSYAAALYCAFERRVEELSSLPDRGRIVPELERQGLRRYRELIEGYYRIIYLREESEVLILAVIDGRRDVDAVLKSRSRRY